MLPIFFRSGLQEGCVNDGKVRRAARAWKLAYAAAVCRRAAAMLERDDVRQGRGISLMQPRVCRNAPPQKGL